MHLFFRLTGGRPMQYLGPAFYDRVAEEPVYYYRDRLDGHVWMASTAWALFRVRSDR